ncbi:MAG TPA: FAD-dependent oxidoreductase, partial [Candidatus Izemoplasmatales bacterium]|nr:FAD-dependent oxidoreductase [Candidatus Izemoplasmatales bacterium]
PAGASAAIYLQRSKLDVLLIMKDYGTLEKTGHIDNYWGFEDTMDGTDLVIKGLGQAKRLGVQIIEEEVLDIEKDMFGHHKFSVKTDQRSYEGKTVLLATGQSKPNLRVKGFREFTGKGISFCAICDGFIYKNKKIGVVGNKKFMSEELETLSNFTKDIKVFTDANELTVDVDFPVVEEKITEIQGDDVIGKVITEKETHEVDALFIAMGTPSANDFALRMGAIIDKNNIVVDDKFMTNIPGLFAAGDCIGGLLQIAKAVSDGAHAALALNKYVRAL